LHSNRMEGQRQVAPFRVSHISDMEKCAHGTHCLTGTMRTIRSLLQPARTKPGRPGKRAWQGRWREARALGVRAHGNIHRTFHTFGHGSHVRRVGWSPCRKESTGKTSSSSSSSPSFPEQGSHTVGLDGSLFKKEQGGHTFSLEPHGAATACCPIPGIPRGQPCVKIEGGRGGHGQHRPRTSPRPGVRVPCSTHQTFQDCTASGARPSVERAAPSPTLTPAARLPGLLRLDE
jgi:hypothetical protein